MVHHRGASAVYHREVSILLQVSLQFFGEVEVLGVYYGRGYIFLWYIRGGFLWCITEVVL